MNEKVYILLVFFLFTFRLLSQTPIDPVRVQSRPNSDVILQGFYWNSTPGALAIHAGVFYLVCFKSEIF